MTEKQMEHLTNMIIEAIDKKQRELDKEFYEDLDQKYMYSASDGQSSDINEPAYVNSESERILIRLHDLYTMLVKLIAEEKFELAEEIRQTIKSIKENYKL